MIPIDKGLETAQIPSHPTPQGAETTQKNAHLYGVRFFVWIIR